MPQPRKGLQMRGVARQPLRTVQFVHPVSTTPVISAPSNNTNNPRNIGWMMALTSAVAVAAVVLSLAFITNPFIAISLSVTAGVALIGGWAGYFITLRSNDLHNVLMSTKGAVDDVRNTVHETTAQIKPLARRAQRVIKQAELTVAAAKKEVPPTARTVRRILESVNGVALELGALIATTKAQVEPLAKSTQGTINAVHGTINRSKKVLVSTQRVLDVTAGVIDTTNKEVPELSQAVKKAIADVTQTTKETIAGNAPTGLVKSAASGVYNATVGRFWTAKKDKPPVVTEGEGVQLTRSPSPVLVEESGDEFFDAEVGRPHDGLNARQRSRQKHRKN